MTSRKNEIEAALVDVRKAYRLLYDYQRSALDAAKYVGSKLGVEYKGGYSHFSNSSPKDRKGSLENWAWDWLNLMFYEFHFQGQLSDKSDINLSIWLFSDTGYFVSNHAAPDKRDINTFALPENSATKMGFLFYRHWDESYYPLLKDTLGNLRRFVEKGEIPSQMHEGGVLGMSCDFSRLSNQISADELIAELVILAKTTGFELDQQNKAK